jgi:hypothetical protein
MRVRNVMTAAAVTSVALVGSVVTGSSAMADVAETAAPADEWVVVGDDAVIGRDGIEEIETHRRDHGQPEHGPMAAEVDEGYTPLDPEVQNYGGYTIVLRDTERIEDYRPLVEDVAARLTLITGATYAVAPGLVSRDDAAIGELLVEVNADMPCGSDPSIVGCGGPEDVIFRAGAAIWASGRVWLNPLYLDLPTDQRQSLIDHEIGHALGLDHYAEPYLGEYQVMYPFLPDPGYTYRAGDENGLRWLDPEPLESRFVPMPPTRVLDTRKGVGRPGTDRVPAGTEFDLQVTGGGVPADARAVVLTLAATSPTGPGHITLYPAGSPRPTVSNLNLDRAGQTIANQAVVKIGQGGRVTVSTVTTTHLVADIAGYFVTADGPTDAGRYVALAPSRLLDTRPTKIAPGATVTLQVGGRGGVPSTGVGAVVLNVAIVQPAGIGHVTVWPEGAPPVASSINADHPNQVIAGHVTVAVGADGKVRLRPAMSTHLVVDVQGYYTGAGAPAATSGLFVPLDPVRFYDSRGGGGPIRMAVLGMSGGGYFFEPGTASGVVFNLAATGTAGPGYARAVPYPPAPSSVSNLNFERAGQTIANLATVRLGQQDRIAIASSVSTHLIVDLAGYYTK